MGFAGAIGVTLPNVPFTDFPDLGKAFKTGFVIEIVEKKTVRKVINAHVFVLNPVRYSLSEPFQSTLTPTEANTVLEEVNGIIVREITLEGTFGLAERTPKSTRSAGSSAPNTFNQNGKADGSTQFAHLRQLFREYSDLKKDPERAPFVKMVFHSLRDDDHWTVVPKSFDTPRDAARTRMHYEYRISLLTTGDAAAIYALPEDSSLLDDAFKVINQALAEATAFQNDINGVIAQLRSKVANIDAVMIGVSGFLTQVGVTVSSSRDLAIDYPRKLALSSAENVRNAGLQLADTTQAAFTTPTGSKAVDTYAAHWFVMLEHALDRIISRATKFSESSQEVKQRTERNYLGDLALTENDLLTNTGGATANSAARVAKGSEGEAGTNFGEYQALRKVQVTVTTTLSVLASVYNVSRELIVVINNLRPPYFTPGGGLGTLKPGDFILIPVAQTSGVPVTDSQITNYRDVEQTLYGMDFALDPVQLALGKLDFKVDSSHGSVDAEYATGVPNITNGLEIILHTEQGETQHVPSVGLSLPVGDKGTLQNVLLAATSMRSSILSDDRIERILSSRLVLDGDTLTQEITPLIRGGGEGLTVVLPLGRASGG